MKIMITGAFGLLGSAIQNSLPENYENIRTGIHVPDRQIGYCLDILDRMKLKEIINLHKPNIIINLAAMTNVDLCEKSPMLARKINVEGVYNICDLFEGKIIQISTDYIFDGKTGPYKEEDAPLPLSSYGKTKLEAEKIIKNHNSDNLIIRGNVLYDYCKYTKASFFNWVINSLKKQKPISVVDDQINNPTWSKSMSKIISLCIEKEISGIYHWGDATFLSRYKFADIIAKKYNLDNSLISPISTEELNQKAPRPLNSGLNSDKLANVLGVVPPTLEECLNSIIVN